MKATVEQYARLLIDSARPTAGAQVEQAIAAVLDLMRRRGDAFLAPRLEVAVQDIWRRLYPLEDVEVRAASGADAWAARIARLVQMDPRDLVVKEDPALLAGVAVRRGSVIADATAAGAFDQLNRCLRS